ncbi:quinolinate synthase NadA [Desulfobacterales bacterium HSG17]|nr:quinolinate synthase NadA [Desulfobacterales bacterium HSG17]
MKDKIRALAKEKNAIILAHNYQPGEIQEIADLCGDSLELSIRAAETEAEVIVFCGVHFMAETASILSPDKKVLLPNLDAGCPMADMVTPGALQLKMAELGNPPVVTYVNSSAAVKALTTICCTSANVVDVVNSMDEDELLMVPDKNLAQWAARHTKKKLHLWEGYCHVHDRLKAPELSATKAKYPDALVLAHPECRPEVLDLADHVVSTSGMLRFAVESDHTEFIVGTEKGLLYGLQKQNPEKLFHPAAPHMTCPNMKKITVHDVLDCLTDLSNEVKVPEDIRLPALKAVEGMIAIK